jgi:Kef-type K+ transport system membrane component KefB
VFWLIFEPILFGLTGTQIDFSEIDSNIMWRAVMCIVVAAVVRVLGTIVISIGSKLNLKEKIFISFSWMAKATVQVRNTCSLILNKNTLKMSEYATGAVLVSSRLHTYDFQAISLFITLLSCFWS